MTQINNTQNENKFDLKQIVSDNNLATISHAIAGVLYYQVNTKSGEQYMFPVDMNDKDDVGTTTFPASIKCITLMRYIRKAISNNSLIKIK